MLPASSTEPVPLPLPLPFNFPAPSDFPVVLKGLSIVRCASLSGRPARCTERTSSASATGAPISPLLIYFTEPARSPIEDAGALPLGREDEPAEQALEPTLVERRRSDRGRPA